MYFRAKKDVIYTAVIWGILLFLAYVYAFGGEPVGDPTVNYRSTPVMMIVILFAALLLWVWLKTGYVVKEGKLNIKNGPFNRQIRIGEIRKIQVRNRLDVHVKAYEVITIAPKKHEAFIDALLKENPNIIVEK